MSRSRVTILAVETSCDETAAAVVENGRSVRSSVIASQIALHRAYAGVVPELASRAHLTALNAVIDRALRAADIPPRALAGHVQAVAYTRGPGLAGALLVGQVAAQALAYAHGLPLIDVNHLEGHLCAALLEHPRLRPPYLALIVSGGHTELVTVDDYGRYRLLGATRDDAVGEAYDKVARLLGLPYPGGPAIDACARTGNPAAVAFPRPYLWESGDFSFSGLKTAVANHVARGLPKSMTARRRAVSDICASFQQAVIDTLVAKTLAAADAHGLRNIVIGGGVAANSALRSRLLAAAGNRVHLPGPACCTDNAAMIACAGFYKLERTSPDMLCAALPRSIEPNLPLRDWDA